MTTTQAGEYLGVTDGRIRQMLRDGELTGEKAGRDWLIRKEHLDALKQQRQDSTRKMGRPFATPKPPPAAE